METVFRLKVSEFNESFLETIKTLFKNDKEIEVNISSITDFNLNITETKEEYTKRIDQAIENIENNKDTISFNEKEFEDLTQNLLKK